MKDKLLRLTKHEYSPIQRMVLMLVLAPIFLILLPWFLITLGSRIDQWLHWSPMLDKPLNLILGSLLCVAGVILGIWSNYVQLTLGRGTPVPLMATQKLIIQPPYNYCRNPMALGAILMYMGVALLFRSMGAVVLVLVGAGILLFYIKRVEEAEMVIRFGQEYLNYKNQTPFLVPRFWKYN